MQSRLGDARLSMADEIKSPQKASEEPFVLPIPKEVPGKRGIKHRKHAPELHRHKLPPRQKSDKTSRLTPRQRKFCECYAAGYSKVEAYRKAGYAHKWTDRSLDSRRADNVYNTKGVRQFLSHLNEQVKMDVTQTPLMQQAILTREGVLLKLAEIANANLTKYLDENGNISPKKVKTDGGADVDSFEISMQGIKVKVRNPIEALREISRIMGFNAPEKHELSAKGFKFEIDLGDGK